MHNADSLRSELDWLQEVLKTRRELPEEAPYLDLVKVLPPAVSGNDSSFTALLRHYNFSFDERLVLILALTNHIYPKLLDVFKLDKLPTAFGGYTGKVHRGFIPTGETLMYLLAGNDIGKRIALLQLFEKDHVFYKDNLVSLEQPQPAEPELSGALTASQDLVDLVLRGKVRKPDLRPDFPAKLLETKMGWEDLVLQPQVHDQLDDIIRWIEHSKVLMSDYRIGNKINPGFRALFFGPPGTGKTLVAALLGKRTGRDVYRVDLSTIVSKYIGETEKNLAKLFDRAERKNWILFFDEADALFGKRTGVNDSHDRYANQEVSYLLQRIEHFDGLVILATNLKSNIDSAFLRRFQSVIHFPMPKPEERMQLWKNAFSQAIPADPAIDLYEVAKKYELSGSLILNIATHATLRALHKKNTSIGLRMLQESIVRELAKEGRTL